MDIEFKLNSKWITVSSIPGHETLLYVLRKYLSMKGTKEGCGIGECGACTVLVDGYAVNSCLVAAGSVQGKSVMTIEGLTENGQLHPLQEAFLETGAVQCGYCTPGMIMSSYSLLRNNPDPTEEEIKTALAGNLCRCTGYKDILYAVKKAADYLRDKK